MQTASATGFYGKLPCKGDFLQQRVTQEFVDTWDPWLQQCMFASREQLQESWLDTYLTSPVWRFALAEGVCGTGAYVGVMVPSVDRVGRYFPLALVAQLSAEDCLLEVATSSEGQQWFESAEALALGALEAHDLDLAAFDEQVAALQGLQGEAGLTESTHLGALLQHSPFGQRPGQWHVPLQSVRSLQRAANVFASRELERTLRPLSLWWTDGSNAIRPCWLCNRGLPAPGSFAGMIGGEWGRSGWESLGPPAAEVPASGPMGSDGAVLEIPAGAEPVEIVAYHTDLARQPNSAPRGHFVCRPEIGLWGFSCSDGQEAGRAAAQTVADLLHDTAAAGSLSALVEEVRRGLEAIQRQAATSAVYGAVVAAAGAVVFLMRANECAAICMGAVQAVRARSREVTTIEGESQTNEVVVHYDTLRAGDLWVLAGSLLLDDEVLAKFPALLARHPAIAPEAVAAVQRFWARNSGVDENELPLMLLAASGGTQRQ